MANPDYGCNSINTDEYIATMIQKSRLKFYIETVVMLIIFVVTAYTIIYPHLVDSVNLEKQCTEAQATRDTDMLYVWDREKQVCLALTVEDLQRLYEEKQQGN